MQPYQALILSLSFLFGLSSCDHVNEAFGMNHYQADEFNVCDNPPISLPPNYDLRPPQAAGAAATSGVQPAAKARNIVGQPRNNSNRDTEQKLLKRMSDGKQASDSIRAEIDSEAKKEPQGAVEKKLEDWKQQFDKNLKSASKDTNEEKNENKKAQKDAL